MPAATPPLSPAQTKLSWLLRLAVAAILVQTLFFKFTAAPESVYIFETLGLEPWGRIGSGIAELVAALLLLVPATVGLGALLALGVISGALVSHLTKLGIEVRGDGGLLFGLAVGVFAGSAALLWLHRGELPLVGARLRPRASRGLAVLAAVLLSGAMAGGVRGESTPPAPLVNVDADGVALTGHDPVAFFTDGKPVAGSPAFTSRHGGATYRFASAEHKALFDSGPAKYAPQFGGYCAYGMSRGYTAPVEVDAFAIVDGRLLLQYDKGVREEFGRDLAGNLLRADKYWPRVRANAGKRVRLDPADAAD